MDINVTCGACGARLKPTPRTTNPQGAFCECCGHFMLDFADSGLRDLTPQEAADLRIHPAFALLLEKRDAVVSQMWG